MKALKDYVEEKNRWNAIFGGRPLSLENAQDRQEIASQIDCELSPENLHCDGEISAGQAMVKYRKLTTVAKQLQKLDPNVTIWEMSY